MSSRIGEVASAAPEGGRGQRVAAIDSDRPVVEGCELRAIGAVAGDDGRHAIGGAVLEPQGQLFRDPAALLEHDSAGVKMPRSRKVARAHIVCDPHATQVVVRRHARRIVGAPQDQAGEPSQKTGHGQEQEPRRLVGDPLIVALASALVGDEGLACEGQADEQRAALQKGALDSVIPPRGERHQRQHPREDQARHEPGLEHRETIQALSPFLLQAQKFRERRLPVNCFTGSGSPIAMTTIRSGRGAIASSPLHGLELQKFDCGSSVHRPPTKLQGSCRPG
mmetsp:Transcript_70448/g.229052  ORF Transcript_70448/g.229052 Transcript_70448/m.229052 type:complete len:280 (+) Transcript_70448:452-1291(+)